VEHLTTHLDLEERTALPLFGSELSGAEFSELASKARHDTPRGQGALQIPRLVDHASPDQRKALFRLAPPFRILNLLNRGRYRRLDGALVPTAGRGSVCSDVR